MLYPINLDNYPRIYKAWIQETIHFPQFCDLVFGDFLCKNSDIPNRIQIQK